MSDKPDKAKEVASKAADLVATSQDWLTRFKQVTDAAPYVYNTMKEAGIIRDALITVPPAANFTGLDEIGSYFQTTNELYQSAQFRLPLKALPIAVTGSASVSGAANCFMSVIVAAQSQTDPATLAWIGATLPVIQKVETEEKRIEFIRGKLRNWEAAMEAEFNLAMTELAKCRAGATTHNAAGIALRNVLERLNGKLRQLARTYDPAADVKGWNDAAVIVARGAPTSAQVSQLIGQETQYKALFSYLSGMLKNDAPPTPSTWDLTFGQYIAFFYTVLGLIDFRDGT